MVGSKAAWLITAVALSAAPCFAQDACGGCDAPAQHDWGPGRGPAGPEMAVGRDRRVVYEQSHIDQAGYDGRYMERSRTVTRVAYSEGFLSWPGKDAGDYADDRGYDQGPRGRMPDCPPVRPGERVISCRYVPLARPAPPQEADIAPAGGVLYAEGGVGPDYIAGGGGGGGTTIIEGGSSNSSSFASASASASVNASIVIKEKGGQQPPHKGGGGGSWGGGGSMGGHGGGSWGGGSGGSGSGGGSWGGGSMGGGGSWGGGSMGGGSGGGSWGGGSMSGGSGSWGSGSMGGHSGGSGGGTWGGGSMGGGAGGGSWSGGVHGGHSVSHGGSHGHGHR